MAQMLHTPTAVTGLCEPLREVLYNTGSMLGVFDS